MAKKVTRIIAVSFVLCFLLFLSVSSFGVQAKVEKTTLILYFHYTEFGEPSRLWFSDGIYHTRDHPHDGWVKADPAGPEIGTISYVGDLNSDNWYDLFPPLGIWIPRDAVGHGKVIIKIDDPCLGVGSFEGNLVFKITGEFLTSKFVYHGSGDFAGMRLKGTTSGFVLGPYYTLVGELLNPHG